MKGCSEIASCAASAAPAAAARAKKASVCPEVQPQVGASETATRKEDAVKANSPMPT